VHLFLTTVKQSASFPKAAGNYLEEGELAVAALLDDGVSDIFRPLSKEVKARIKHESGHLAATAP
jgi:hypothetical protein